MDVYFEWMRLYLESLPGIGLGKAKKLFKLVQNNKIVPVNYVI
jgi:hypothetical protein